MIASRMAELVHWEVRGPGALEATLEPAIVYKRCTLCGEYKLLTAFHRMRSMYNGRYPRCKECRRRS
jgi:hypothetical protein